MTAETCKCLVYVARLEDVDDLPDGLLDDTERRRSLNFSREVDRARFIVGCGVSRAVLGRLLDIPPEYVAIARECEYCGQPHGRPRPLQGAWQLSVSHSGALVLVTVTNAGPVGVDVERISAETSEGVEYILTTAELAALSEMAPQERLAGIFRYWVRKESVLKSTGDGLRGPLAELLVSEPDKPARLVHYPGRSNLPVLLHDLDVDAGYAAAVAVVSAEPIRVRCIRWEPESFPPYRGR